MNLDDIEKTQSSTQGEWQTAGYNLYIGSRRDIKQQICTTRSKEPTNLRTLLHILSARIQLYVHSHSTQQL